MKDSQKSGPKEMDAKIASYFYENGIAFNTLQSFPHPLVRETGQLMDTSRQRSSDPQQAKPWLSETTEKTCYVYLNNKMEATVLNAC